jgi:chromosome segregation ATPase
MLATYTAVIDEHRAAAYDRRKEDLAIARFVSLLAKQLPQIMTKVKTGQIFTDSETRDALFQQWPFEQTRLADEARRIEVERAKWSRRLAELRDEQTRRSKEFEEERAKWSARVDALSERQAELRDKHTRRSKEFEEERAKWSARVDALRDKQTRLRRHIDELKEELKKTRHELAAVKPGVVRRLQSYLKRTVNSRPSES